MESESESERERERERERKRESESERERESERKKDRGFLSFITPLASACRCGMSCTTYISGSLGPFR